MFRSHQRVPTHLFSSRSNCIPLVSQFRHFSSAFGKGLLKKEVRIGQMVKWVPEMNALGLAHCKLSDTGALRDGQIGLKTFTKLLGV